MTAITEPFAPISLEEVANAAPLLKRTDRKYLLDEKTLAGITATFRDEYRILEIGTTRAFHYDTVYFDTPQLRFFYDHAGDRRLRHKVRVRHYADTGAQFLEVKSKGRRGITVKDRIPHTGPTLNTLGNDAAEFVDPLIGFSHRDLRPVLRTHYSRFTLVREGQRVTCDSDLTFSNGHAAASGPRQYVVETKSSGRAGPFDLALRRAGVRPHRVSKYCSGLILLNPELPKHRWLPELTRYFGVQPRYSVRRSA